MLQINMNKTREAFSLFLIILIFGSGLAIFVWNLMLGKDLSIPPKFDLSAYDDMSAFDEIKENLFTEPAKKDLENSESLSPEEINEAEVALVLEEREQMDLGIIYFKDSFRLNTAVETTNLISSFLDDFPELKELEIENLESKKIIEVELPAINREGLIVDLEENNSQIKKVTMLEPPVWQIELIDEMYEKAVLDMLLPYNGVVVKTVFDSDSEYIAEVDIKELEISEDILDKLENEYSDVITLVRP